MNRTDQSNNQTNNQTSTPGSDEDRLRALSQAPRQPTQEGTPIFVPVRGTALGPAEQLIRQAIERQRITFRTDPDTFEQFIFENPDASLQSCYYSDSRGDMIQTIGVSLRGIVLCLMGSADPDQVRAGSGATPLRSGSEATPVRSEPLRSEPEEVYAEFLLEPHPTHTGSALLHYRHALLQACLDNDGAGQAALTAAAGGGFYATSSALRDLVQEGLVQVSKRKQRPGRGWAHHLTQQGFDRLLAINEAQAADDLRARAVVSRGAV